MPTVSDPNGNTHNFPDGTTPEQMTAAMQTWEQSQKEESYQAALSKFHSDHPLPSTSVGFMDNLHRLGDTVTSQFLSYPRREDFGMEDQGDSPVDMAAGGAGFRPPAIVDPWGKAGPGEVASGGIDIGKGDISKGLHRAITGTGVTLAPALPSALVAAPLATSLGIAGSSLGSPLIRKAAKVSGATDDQADLWGDAGGIVAGGLASGIPKLGSGMNKLAMKGLLGTALDDAIPGTDITRGDLARFAKEHGLNLDAADITNNPILKAIKGFSERSLGGMSTMAANRDANFAALQDAAKGVVGDPANAEATGGLLQKMLRDDYATSKAAATDAYKGLDESVGKSVINAKGLQDTAQSILDQNQTYYDKHPELIPRKGWSIVNDLATRPIVQEASPASGLVDQFGKKLPGQPTVFDQNNHMSFSELSQLRSELMEVYRDNPDLIKSKSNAWMQTLTSKVDNEMTGAESSLTPNQVSQFRQANSIWAQLKGTYDNPQHPFYHAIRSEFPSQVPNLLTNGSPELARQVASVMGDNYSAVQKNYITSLLDKNGDGVFDLKNFSQRVNNKNAPEMDAILGLSKAGEIRKLAALSRVVNANANPSGTSSVLLPAAELSGLVGGLVNPAAIPASLGSIGAGYLGAKGLTSDFATSPLRYGTAGVNPDIGPLMRSVLTSVAAQNQKKPNSQ